MKLKYEKKIIDSFHDQVTVSYCGFQVSRIVEKGIRKRLRGANLKSSALDFDGVLRKAADRLSRARRLVRPREEALPWSPGDTLFVCHNETAFGGVLPLIDEMTTQKVACTVILPEEARNWASSRASVEDVKWVFGASLRETPVSGEIKAVVRAFKKQASAFLVQHQLRGAGPLRSDMVAHAKHALTRIELIRGWIKRAEPDRIVVSQPKEEPLYHSLAGRLEGVPTVIVPHGVLRGGDVFRPAFYDLGLFDIGL